MNTSISFFISLCWYVDAFTLDLQKIFKKLGIQNRKKTRKVQTEREYLRKIDEIVKETIQMHCDIIEFVNFQVSMQWKDIFRFLLHSRTVNNIQKFIALPIFFELTACVALIGFGLFGLKQTKDSVLKSTDFYFHFQILLVDILILFVYCFFGEHLTHDTMKILTIVDRSAWYRIPLNQQRSLAMLMQRAQRIFRLKSFGGLECSRRLCFKVNGQVICSFHSIVYNKNSFQLIRLSFSFCYYVLIRKGHYINYKKE